ncbi:EmrB/QacA subfamily drug resistance transporter [Marmoricola sp. URHA0025 HA25]
MSTETESRRPLVVLLTAVAYFMTTLDALVVVTALPSIHEDLGGSVAALQWTVNAYSLAFATGIITASVLGDRLGRRRVYRVGLAVFTLASVACALAPTLPALVAFRTVQGLGAAIVMPLGMTLLTAVFPAEKRGVAVGLWGGIAGLGVAAGPLIGGAVTQGLDWHWVFWVNVPVGVAAWVGSRFVLAESRGADAGLDIPGMVLVAAGIGSLVWGLVQGPDAGWSAARTVVALAAGVVLLVGFLVWESRTSTPMVPLALFGHGTFAAAAATCLMMTGSVYSMAFLTSEFFQLGRGNDPLGTGLRFLPWTATPLLVAPVAGILFDRIGARRLAVPGLLMQSAGFLWIMKLAGEDASYAQYVAPFILAGVGISMVLPSVPAAGLNAVPPEFLGRASGVLNTLQQVGAVVGIAAVTVAFDARGSLASPAQVTSGYRAAVLVTVSLSTIGALIALRLRRPSAPAVGEVEPIAVALPEAAA